MFFHPTKNHPSSFFGPPQKLPLFREQAQYDRDDRDVRKRRRHCYSSIDVYRLASSEEQDAGDPSCHDVRREDVEQKLAAFAPHEGCLLLWYRAEPTAIGVPSPSDDAASEAEGSRAVEPDARAENGGPGTSAQVGRALRDGDGKTHGNDGTSDFAAKSRFLRVNHLVRADGRCLTGRVERLLSDSRHFRF